MKNPIAYCGLDCEKCEAYIATKNNDDALREKVAKLWSELNGVEITPGMINCNGCRENGVKTVYCESLCPIRQCALGKSVNTCGGCAGFEKCEKVRAIISNNQDALKNLRSSKTYRFYGWESADIKDARGLTPRDYYDILSDIWCAETCAPRMRKDWSPENKTLGQCSITAFLMQDIYGGKVYGIPLDDGGYHLFNAVGDCVFDLTSEQFGGVTLDYNNRPEQFREVHFAKEEKKNRYERLRTALMKAIGN